MQTFFRFWYIQSLPWALERFRHNLAQMEGIIAISATLRNLGKPLFQDYTLAGRLIGFFLRIFRIFFGLLTYAVVAVAHVILYLFWLLLPLLCIVTLVGFFAAGPIPSTNLVPGSESFLP